MKQPSIFSVVTLSILIGRTYGYFGSTNEWTQNWSSNRLSPSRGGYYYHGENDYPSGSSSQSGGSSEGGSSSQYGRYSHNGRYFEDGSSSQDGRPWYSKCSWKQGCFWNVGTSSTTVSPSMERSISENDSSSPESMVPQEVPSPETTENLSTPEECARTCVVGEKPKTCYYHFTVETYATQTRACNFCTPNETTRLTSDCQCIVADGVDVGGIKVVNRMFPGPSILVCRDDYVVIDVENKVHGNGITIHWHGIFQNGYQYYDGVPYVTQCPIAEGTTFRYQWRAKNSGTHFWHSHSGLQKGEGMDGSIIVREPKVNEPNNELWDYDEIDHVIFINDWMHDSVEAHFPGNLHRNILQMPDNYLINGLGQWTDPLTGITNRSPLATFTVTPGGRYRFRMINACCLNCPVQLTIQAHNLTVIATDGESVLPVTVNSITSFSAERYDFVLNADQAPGSYWIQVRGLGECFPLQVQQLAILRYESADQSEPALERPSYRGGLDAGLVLNQMNVRCDGSPAAANVVCVSQLESAESVDPRILQKEPDVKLFIPFGFHDYTEQELYRPGTYQNFIVPLAVSEVVATMGKNITNASPPSTLISQRDEISEDQFCTLDSKPSKCNNSAVCECSLVEKIPLNSVVEIILVDEGRDKKILQSLTSIVQLAKQSIGSCLINDAGRIPGVSHPFHLHGASFYVIGEGVGDDYNILRIDTARVRELDEMGMMTRRLSRPPRKDTYAVFNNGFSIIRFVADNPGYWLFHCHFLYHLAVGMAAVFQIGEASDLPPIPKGFPRCGNFVPPIADDF